MNRHAWMLLVAIGAIILGQYLPFVAIIVAVTWMAAAVIVMLFLHGASRPTPPVKAARPVPIRPPDGIVPTPSTGRAQTPARPVRATRGIQTRIELVTTPPNACPSHERKHTGNLSEPGAGLAADPKETA